MGRAYTRKLKSQGYYVFGTSRHDMDDMDKEESPNKTLLVPNLSKESCQYIIDNCPSYINMMVFVAGFGKRDDLITDAIRVDMEQVNLTAPVYLSSKCLECDTIIFTSSFAALKRGTKNLKVYSDLKREAEVDLTRICTIRGIRLVLVRPSAVPQTAFCKTAKIKEIAKKENFLFPGPSKLVEEVFANIDQEWIYPGRAAKALYVLNRIHPALSAALMVAK